MFKDSSNRDIQVGDVISLNARKGRQKVLDLDEDRNIIYYQEQGSNIIWAGDWNYYKERATLVSAMSSAVFMPLSQAL